MVINSTNAVEVSIQAVSPESCVEASCASACLDRTRSVSIETIHTRALLPVSSWLNLDVFCVCCIYYLQFRLGVSKTTDF